MGYRKDSSHDRRWKKFVWDQRQLFEQASLPMACRESSPTFDYLLMHGYLPATDAGPQFDVAELRPAETTALKKLICCYLQDFYDPGLGLFSEEQYAVLRAGGPIEG